MRRRYSSHRFLSRETHRHGRLVIIQWVVIVGSVIIFFRLFNLQVLSYEEFKAAADGEHTFYTKVFPRRGEIYVQDRGGDARVDSLLIDVGGEKVYPAAINREYPMLYAVPKEIQDKEVAARDLASLLGIEEKSLAKKLKKENDLYEVVRYKLTPDEVEKVKRLSVKGLYFKNETHRYYPEKGLGGHVFGYVGNDGSTVRGLYGIEGYFHELLKGKEGSLRLERDAIGTLIPTAKRQVIPAVDGSNIILTIDRTVQMVACDRLNAWVHQHGADGGSVVIMNPATGKIIAMCNTPDYDPGEYQKFDISRYVNTSIFTPYEPGSIFKPLTMAMALDQGTVTPDMMYEDTGKVVIGPYTIRNSDGKKHGRQTMVDVLDESLNTGAIFVARTIGLAKFRDYVKAFGFGTLTGIQLDRESPGTIDSLKEEKEIYLATASFGQGITVTPLQMLTAYTALANGGNLLQPSIVDMIIRPDGIKVTTKPRVVRRVISERAASLVSGMLVSVVRKGHGKRAGVAGYYVAGKTGTAQVPKKDGRGYEPHITIGSFVGFAPVDNPKFVMLVKIDRPRDVQWAESSAAPLFGDLAKFLLDYYEVPPDEEEQEIRNKK